MKKTVLFFIILSLFAFSAFASSDAHALFDSIQQYSTEELLHLRELVNAELKQRNADSSNSPVYILNVNTRKFHFPSCRSVKDIKEKNKLEFNGERDELITKEYAPCKKCNP